MILDSNAVNVVNDSFNACEEHAQNVEAEGVKMKYEQKWDCYSIIKTDRSTFNKYSQREGIESFELELSGELNRKLKHIIENFEDLQSLTPLQSVEKVIVFGITRCNLISYWQFKTYMFMQSEVFKNIKIAGDPFCYAIKNWNIDDDISFKYKNYLILDRVSDYDEELKLSKNFEEGNEINAFNITLTGNLRSQFLDLSEIWSINYGISKVKTLEYAIEIAINYIYELVSDYDHEEIYDINELIDNVFSYDQY